MADQDTIPLSDFLGSAKTVSATVPEQADTASLGSFMSGGALDSLSAQAPQFEPLREEHKHGFLASMGLKLYAGALNAQAGVNSALGYLLAPVGAVLPEEVKQGAADLFINNQLKEARQIYQDTHSDNPVAQFAYDFAESIGGMGFTLPIDIATGGATKAWMAGKVLPAVEALASRIPDFALGSGWRGLVEGMSRSENPIEGVVRGIAQAGENVSINSLYAKAGEGIPGILKMTAMGGAESVYQAAKEGRVATPEEIAKGSANGMAFGTMFAMFPHIREATGVVKEKVALGQYEAQIKKAVAEGRLTPDEIGDVESTWAPSNKVDEPYNKPFIVGKLYKDRVGEDPYVYESQYVDPKVLLPNVNLEGKTYQEVVDMPTTQKYIQWYKEGRVPPPVDVVKTDTGALRSVNRRRVVAAIEAGVPSIPANVEVGRESDVKKGKINGSLQATLERLFADERIRPEIKQALLTPLHDPLKTTKDSIVPPELNFGTWKDRASLLLSLNTLERNNEKVAGSQAREVNEFTSDKIKVNETYRAEWLTKTRAYIRGEMDRLGIKIRSEESKYVQRYGEGKTTEAELQQKFPDKWKNIVEAAGIFRTQYDALLDTINQVSKNFGLEPIKKLDNYFRHFQEMGESFLEAGFMHSPKTAEAGIPNKTRPKKPFTSVEIERKGKGTVEDALGGFDNWLDAAGNRIFHTDSVQRVRAMENYVRTQAAANESIDLANYVTNLKMYGDILAGKTLSIDQGFRDLFGRRAFGFMRFLDKQVSKNMILYNASSALMNFIPFTQSVSTMNPIHSTKGLFEAVHTPFNTHAYTIDGVKSDLYARRYPANKLAVNNWERAEQAGGFAFSVVDQFAVKAIIAGKYHEARAEGLGKKEAMQKADDFTERLVTDRSWGQLPVAFEAKSLGVLTRFQVEVTNMAAWVTQDIPQQYKGQVGKLVFASAMFALNSYLFNEVMEKVVGRRPTIDPIYALATVAGVTKNGVDKELGERLVTAGKDIGGQMPFGNLIVEGGRFPILAGVPNVWKMVGDPGRHLFPELARPTMMVAMPFGGGQIKKSFEGIVDFARGESLTPAGEMRYGIEQEFSNFMRGFLFGKSAFPEAVEYWAGITRRE